MDNSTRSHITRNFTDTTDELPRVRTNRETDEVPRCTDNAQFIVLSGPGAGTRYAVHDKTLIGRDTSAEVWIPDEGISRRHARIDKLPSGGFVLSDLDSRNGTCINGLPITRAEVKFGDRIAIGNRTVLVFTHENPAERTAFEQQKMEAIGRLASGVAHEFNNLLAVVMNNLTLIERDPSDEQRQCALEARQALNRGSELTRQLLDFSRQSSSDIAQVDVRELLLEVASFAQRTLGRPIQVEISSDAELLVAGDRLQLYQVLMNLCINASDALGRGDGKIALRAAPVSVDKRSSPLGDLEAGPHVEITVCDNGRGMDADTLEKAFEPFFTTKPPGDGTGLGLSMALGLIKNHRGSIELVSEPRQGTTARLLLRHIEATDSTSSAAESSEGGGPAPSGAGHYRIMLVDDDEMVRSSTRRLLRSFGHQVIEAADGSAAVTALEQHPNAIDLVLLDAVMPGLSGAETFALLRRIDPQLRVVICSGYSRKEAAAELLERGALGFLGKPYETEKLQSVIERTARRRSKS